MHQKNYRCDDGTGSVEINEMNAIRAAIGYVEGGDYESRDRTYWVLVKVSTDDDQWTIRVAIAPSEPPCKHGYKHRWDNRGVRGNGGGAVSTDECPWCGARRITDTWASDPNDGEQGLEQIWFEEARDDFQPRPLRRYPVFNTLIEDGDQIIVEDDEHLVAKDDDEPCGWSVRQVGDEDGLSKKNLFTFIGENEDRWTEVGICAV